MADTCRSCGKPILWVVTAAGKRMPLDVEESPRGNVAHDGHTCEVLSGPDLESARENGEPLYLSHFATCPSAAAHRKKGG